MNILTSPYPLTYNSRHPFTPPHHPHLTLTPTSRTVDVGPPKKPLRRADRDGNLTLVQRLLLYDFLEVSG